MKEKVGILLTNIGTPEKPTPTAVKAYLKEFLSDQDVVTIPKILWWPILYGFILPFRSKNSAKLYQNIWTSQGSPLLVNMEKITASLQKHFFTNKNITIAMGMHYGKPSIQTSIEFLKLTQLDKLIILPLYPQYSYTTTKSSFNKVHALVGNKKNFSVIESPDYAENSDYINALTESINQFWQNHKKPQHLLFSFHGLPEQFVHKGDPYPSRCFATAKAVASQLQLKPQEWSVSFQSRLGKAKWLQPYTENVLKEFPLKKITSLHVICPGFSVDCLETLEEINLRGRHSFEQAGGKIFEYIPALNAQENHIIVLSNLIKKLLSETCEV